MEGLVLKIKKIDGHHCVRDIAYHFQVLCIVKNTVLVEGQFPVQTQKPESSLMVFTNFKDLVVSQSVIRIEMKELVAIVL